VAVLDLSKAKALTRCDELANLVLQSTTERIFAPSPEGSPADSTRGFFADVSHGIFLVRGENVLLLGEIDLDKDDDPPPGYQRAELELVKKLAEEKKAVDKAREKHRVKKLMAIGFEGENLGELTI
jgi:U6 snRNA-associated Sm-like protein LSm1